MAAASSRLIRGRFWLPESPDATIVGHIDLRDGRSALIDLESHLVVPGGHLSASDPVPVIYGVLEHPFPETRGASDHRKITATDGFVSRSNILERGPSMAVANNVYVGEHFVPPLLVTSLSVEFDALDGWFGSSGISHEVELADVIRRVTVTYERPTPLIFSIPGDARIEIQVRLRTGISTPPAIPVVLHPIASATIHLSAPRSLDDVWSTEIRAFMTLLSFMTGRRAESRRVSARAAEEAGGAAFSVCRVTHIAQSEADLIEAERQLLPRDAIKGREPEIAQAWWSILSDRPAPILEIVDSMQRDRTYDSTSLLRMATLSEGYANVIHQTVGRLRDKLRFLVERIGGDTARLIAIDNDDLLDIVSVRHYLAHGMSRDLPRALGDPRRIIQLTDKLDLLLASNLLLDLGLDEPEIRPALRRRYRTKLP